MTEYWTGRCQDLTKEDRRRLYRIPADYRKTANYLTGTWLNIRQKDGIRPGQEDGIILDQKMAEYWKER
jgi:hypothetical protein